MQAFEKTFSWSQESWGQHPLTLWFAPLFVQRGSSLAALWIHCWHRSTQMSGWCWQTSGSGGNIPTHFERHDTPQGHLLSQWCWYQLSNRSAAVQILGLGGTSTLNNDSVFVNTVELIPFLSLRSCVLGTVWLQHPWGLWEKKQGSHKDRRKHFVVGAWEASDRGSLPVPRYYSEESFHLCKYYSPTLRRKRTKQQRSLLLMAASDEECCLLLGWI